MVAIPMPQPQWEGGEDLAEPEPRSAPGPVVHSRQQARPRALPRLTKAERLRRRRLTTLVAAALLVVVVGTLAQALSRGSEPATPMTPLSSVDGGHYVVQPGDTLWSIAERLAPGTDPRPFVAELRSRHGAVELRPGDRLDVTDLARVPEASLTATD